MRGTLFPVNFRCFVCALKSLMTLITSFHGFGKRIVKKLFIFLIVAEQVVVSFVSTSFRM